MRVKRVATHPGIMLSELFLKDLNITQSMLAKALGVSFKTVNELVNAKRSVSVDMALKLAKALNTSAEFWLNAQNAYDLSLADETKLKNVRVLISA
ncbi:HigA family addiction module antitoxin [Campylobacter troglodytis]|uniref:HigA family addiction module antitoxin n=1 Tax=Campylobacter troglodytis TaxID=654363 RepID=UPI00115B9085|nr:HigA family addiction module antitoxin [Campylobacter troglodytis]TQR60747.1 addiction module antidote protein, HigA family [Campylobacter troglodytis]